MPRALSLPRILRHGRKRTIAAWGLRSRPSTRPTLYSMLLRTCSSLRRSVKGPQGRCPHHEVLRLHAATPESMDRRENAPTPMPYQCPTGDTEHRGLYSRASPVLNRFRYRRDGACRTYCGPVEPAGPEDFPFCRPLVFTAQITERLRTRSHHPS